MKCLAARICSFVTLVATTGLWASAIAQRASEDDSARVTMQRIDADFHAVQAIPDVQCKRIDQALYVLCDAASRKTIWAFTLPGHSAHPALVRRVMVADSQSIGIKASGHYAGSKGAFDRWFNEF